VAPKTATGRLFFQKIKLFPAVDGGFTGVKAKQRPRDLPRHRGAPGLLGPCESLELVKLSRRSWRAAVCPWGPAPKRAPRQLTLHSTNVEHPSFLDGDFQPKPTAPARHAAAGLLAPAAKVPQPGDALEGDGTCHPRGVGLRPLPAPTWGSASGRGEPWGPELGGDRAAAQLPCCCRR